MAILLPRTASKPENQDPRILVLMSNTKVGKSSSLLQLPNSLLIDLEDGASYYEGVSLNLKKESLSTGKGMGSLLIETANLIKEANVNNEKPIYDFIAIDTLTVISDIAKLKAVIDYKSSLQGKNYNGKDVTKDLPKGAGWAYFNTAFSDLIGQFKGLAGKCLILVAHAKLSTIDKGGTEVTVNDAELTGKTKLDVMAHADAIGFLYRNKKNVNQNILTFKTSESDLVCGSRSPHLRNKEFVFSEYNPVTNELKTNWHLIFTSLQTKATPKMIEVQDEDTELNNGTNKKIPV